MELSAATSGFHTNEAVTNEDIRGDAGRLTHSASFGGCHAKRKNQSRSLLTDSATVIASRAAMGFD
jgi:hypothetical protein